MRKRKSRPHRLFNLEGLQPLDSPNAPSIQDTPGGIALLPEGQGWDQQTRFALGRQACAKG
jgi:hypothetical protein